MHKYLIFSLFLLLLLSLACEQKRNIRAYYFPAYELNEGKVYAYELTTNGTMVNDYWYYHSFLRDSGVFLASTNYDQLFEVRQLVREKLTESGAVARDYLLVETDTSTGKSVTIPAQLTAPDLFPFTVQDSLGVFLFNLRYRPFNDSTATIYLIRNRRFLGDGPDFQLGNKAYPTIRMGLREVLGNEQEGSAEIEVRGEEWYAKGLGLVYFKKTYGSKGALVREYKLKECFLMEELERRAAE